MARQNFWVGIAILLALSVAAFAGQSGTEPKSQIGARLIQADGRPAAPAPRWGLDEVVYYEDFEDGLAGWLSVDNTAVPGTWHIDDYSAFQGTSWWSGDSTVGPNGGYLNGWYMILDSPPIQLGATPTLRFWHRYAVETPGGEPEGYNGWDGCNLRISTNNGSTWTVVPSAALSPAYDQTSLYSFGVEHGEGPNVPGWCGENTTWHQQSANLSAWASQSVKLRWAFASDPGFATPDDPDLFGWMVDNIRVFNGANDTVFSHDANAVEGFSSTTNVPVGGNLWRIDTDASSPSGPNVLVCNNAATDLYNPNMDNACISPLIDLTDYSNGICVGDFVVTGVLPACDAFPDCDYWGCEVSIDSGQSWCYISNPTCDPGGTNYVYVDAPPGFASFNASYSIPIDFSALLGNVLRLKFTFESNDDALLDVGPKFDSVTVFYSAGFPNDVSAYTLQVRYPNMVNRPFRVKGYFSNPGNNDQTQIQAWYQVIGQTARRFLPNLDLESGESESRIGNVTLSTAGSYNMRTWTILGSDGNPDNDTSHVYQIEVHPSGPDLEIGYDNRVRQGGLQMNAAGTGPLTLFTPGADSVMLNPYNINSVKAQFWPAQTGAHQFRLHVYRGGATTPGQEIVNQMVTVEDAEADTNIWKTIDISGDPDTRNIAAADPFWVWIEITENDANRFPWVIGANEELWDDGHYAIWNGSGAPTTSAYFFQVHAVINDALDADEVTTTIPSTWSLEQNYPNPFNPTTQISFSAPKSERMTLKVYNVVGELVATLVDGTINAGVHSVDFDGASLASGVYVYRLESASFTASHKMVLMK